MIGVLFFTSLVIAVTADIAGVSPANAEQYFAQDGTFKCLDGSKTIPFDYVNDDYCDCDDGTDEPGTSACPNGWFYCKNEGYLPMNIPSSRVNDFICDCCDGSDEASGATQCENTCMEMGRAFREESERKRKLAEEGFKKRQQWSLEGISTRQQKEEELLGLEAERDTLAKEKEEKDIAKKAAEEPEKVAKDEYEQKKQAAEDEKKAKKAFAELDTNSDGMVDVSEMQTHTEFDIDNSGDVNIDEAKEHLEDNESVDVDVFTSQVWSHIKDIYKTPPPPIEEPPTEEPTDEQTDTTPPPVQDGDDHDEDEHDIDDEDERNKYSEEAQDDDDDDDDKDEEAVDARSDEDDDDFDRSDSDTQADDGYPEDVKQLIEAADQARAEYNEADQKHRDMDNKIKEIKDYLELDFGPDNSFAALYDQCFEYTDREYTYKLCAYKSASQRNKNGGSETSLGRWESWSGGEGDERYTKMKYTNGQSCWNGPNRSVEVTLHCGGETELTSASEPNRCEYAFDLTTPAACEQPDAHTEL